MRKRRLIRWAALLTGLALVVSACSSSSPSASTAVSTPAATAAPSTAASAPASAPASAAACVKSTGVTVSLLTFNGPQVAEPLQRRAPDYECKTGNHINVDAVGFQDIYDLALLDAATGTNRFDAYVFDPQWMGDFVTPGYLEDLTDKVKANADLKWDDIGPFFRDFNATYNGKVYTIPLDGDFHMVYYRSDLIQDPPKTWDDYIATATKFQGQDLNGDGQPDYGSCIAKKKGQQSYWWIISVAAGLLQGKGTGQGAFFDTTNMNPLTNNEAFAKALEMYKKTKDYGPPDEINLGVGDTRGLFTTGRCALSMDWGDIGTLALGTYAQDKTGATITPGWKEVLDRTTGKLVPCDTTTCPDAVDGVNYAPFASFGGWSGAINAAVKDQAKKDAAFDFLSYMSAPEQANEDVTLGKTGYNPYRLSQFQNLDLWKKAGMSEAAAKSYLGAIGNSLQSPNMVLDLRIPLTKQYEQDVLDTAVSQFIAGELTTQETMQQITDGWNAITDKAGRDKQLAAYNASLGVQR
jgi:multiple sugar transport system substrate-binding protein